MFTIHDYATEGDIDNLTILLQQPNVDINEKGESRNETALHRACIKGYFEIVKLLLQHEIDIYALDKYQDTAFWDLSTTASATQDDLAKTSDDSAKKVLEDKITECLKTVELLLTHEKNLRSQNPEKYQNQPWLLDMPQHRAADLRERLEECFPQKFNALLEKLSLTASTAKSTREMDAAVELTKLLSAGAEHDPQPAEAETSGATEQPFQPVTSIIENVTEPKSQLRQRKFSNGIKDETQPLLKKKEDQKIAASKLGSTLTNFFNFFGINNETPSSTPSKKFFRIE